MKRLMLVIVVAVSLFASESEARCRRRLLRRSPACCVQSQQVETDQQWVLRWCKKNGCALFVETELVQGYADTWKIDAPSGFYLVCRSGSLKKWRTVLGRSVALGFLKEQSKADRWSELRLFLESEVVAIEYGPELPDDPLEEIVEGHEKTQPAPADNPAN